MVEGFGKRFKKAYKMAGFTQKSLGDEMEITKDTVGNWVREASSPSAASIREVVRLLRARGVMVAEEWLLQGKGDEPRGIGAMPHAPVELPADAMEPVERVVRAIPIFNIDAGPTVIYGDEGYEPGFADRFCPDYDGRDPNAFALHVRGDSMEPDIPKDFICVVEPTRHLTPRCFVVFCTDNRREIKQYIPLKDGSIKFHPTNPLYDDIIVSPKDVKYIWRITRIFKDV